jgi:hypothetical protein
VTVLERTFREGKETIHAVLLRQSSKLRWNAFFWGAGLRFANSFARRENAEKWLAEMLRRYFPGVETELFPADSPSGGPSQASPFASTGNPSAGQ